MGAVNRSANRNDSLSLRRENGDNDAAAGVAVESRAVVQSQAQTRQAHPAPQVETAEAVAC